ncbi:hypothetical protein THTE_3834 [Thermogutta terrifontis]|uniref:Uncharacterized protein n=1 Tax=Thermogutta terrifontis TaxID=1331910 RepID=A0A286RKE3_9BACT|nr:hypothetical protein THTE_3834 [Thermogutta terrifontis]
MVLCAPSPVCMVHVTPFVTYAGHHDLELPDYVGADAASEQHC